MQGESRFSNDYPCLVNRVAINVTAGVSNYTLDDSVFNIRRITWLGWKLEPFSQRDLRNTLMSGTQPGRPRYYNYSNIGRQTIQLYPVPIINVPPVYGDDLWGAQIGNAVIVEYYAIADGIVNKLPLYMRRRFLKAFTLWRCYLMEGKGQNLKAASYYSQKWEMFKTMYEDIFNDLINKPRNLTTDPYVKDLPYPPFARLPIDKFGVDVSDEY